MLTIRCVVAVLLVASCAGDKEVKTVEVKTPESAEQAPVTEDKGETTPALAVAEAPNADTASSHSVMLTSAGSKKIHVIKIVREYTKLGLKDTKELVESAPVELMSGLSKADADAMLAKLQAVGATAELK